MSSSRERQDGLPDIYLSPSHHLGRGHGTHTSSDTEPNTWEDTDSGSWTGLVPEVTLSSGPCGASYLGLREKIEGGSSHDFVVVGTSRENEAEKISEYSKNADTVGPSNEECLSEDMLCRGTGQFSRQRGETPGSDCPPVAGITAFVRRLGQPLNLDTQSQATRSSELIFSPGGDQGFILPGGIHAYYGSGSDTEALDWEDGEGPALVPIRDAVEGADAAPSPDQVMVSSVENLERNSPAGLSTPDAEIYLSVASGRISINKKAQKSIRPPAVGQSEELLVQASRKDLGSTDGEESEEENRKRPAQEAAKPAPSHTEAHQGSLGSQSENTDSVNTVLDMSRGEVQGCENDCVIDTPVSSSAQVIEATLTQPVPKPVFVVGGLISPRGKLRQFQDAVRDRMQDVKASLELGSGSAEEPVDRQHYLSQPPLYSSIIPVCEPEVSLASLASMESTIPPDSSDRVTSPSVLSVSSVASSKRMEWDSGADVGYLGTTTHVTPAASLSTLERIALGSYASVLRTEPEGTTQAKEKHRISRKGGRSGGGKGSQVVTVKHSIAEPSTSSPLHSARTHQSRDKFCLSTSDEDLGNKMSSPTQSPRRRLRRRGPLASPREGDTSLRRSTRAIHSLDKRMREITQAHHNEGKSSSLVELATPAVSSGEYRRSSSQQSLLPVRSQAMSSISVATDKDSSGTALTVLWKNKGDPLMANTSTSTSTLVQSMSPLLAATTTTPLGNVKQLPGGREENKSAADDSRCSSLSSLTVFDRDCVQNLHGKPSWASSANDVSSRSGLSSPAWLPSHTDTESLTSCPLSDDEPSNLKARKNSENARNHENTLKKSSSCDTENSENQNAGSSSPSSGYAGVLRGAAPDIESTLESQVSLQSFNNALHVLSIKLQEHIQALLDNGSLRRVEDYKKLQDYVQFVGIPSVTEEECRLRQGVAGVITRMFGEIAFDNPQVTTDTSNTFTSETSDSHTGDQNLPTLGMYEDLDIPQPCDVDEDKQQDDGREEEQLVKGGEQKAEEKEQEQKEEGGEEERCITPSGTVLVMPYRPPSATRTYFMAVSNEWEVGSVEGEHVPASSRTMATSSTLEVHRGQAEGERESDAATSLTYPSPHPPASSTCPSPHHPAPINSPSPPLPASPSPSHAQSDSSSTNEGDSENLVNREAATRREDGFEALSSLPSDCQFLGRRQDTATPYSEGSLGHTSPLLSGWLKEESGSSQWWSGGRCERLYQDRQGTLHVAHQPPGYNDDNDDSHPSESLSDHDHRQHHQSGDPGRPPARLWTSSGSESAYETIRERHRHVDEALASSFEFYSTSPRDARLLGYVSSEVQDPEEEEVVMLQRTVSPTPPPSPVRSDPAVPHKPQSLARHQQAEKQTSSPSSHTDGNDISSQISLIQQQKRRYVRKIQRHIQTLEKLEKALLDQLGDSIGSNGTFRRRVTEGRSHTESDTNGKVHTMDIMGHSETTTSSIMSSEDDEKATKKPQHQGVTSQSSQPSGQDSLSMFTKRKSESIRLFCGVPGVGQSHTSSPRVTLSQRSSDMTSSRASTMRQIEEEVRKLASTEEQSRRVMLQPHPSSSPRGLHSHHSRSLQREEPWGEEDPVQLGFPSQSVQSNTLESSVSGRRRTPVVTETLVTRRAAAGSSSSDLQSARAQPISEEEASDLPVSDSQISRQGDGRESRERSQTTKAPLVTAAGGKIVAQKPPSAGGIANSRLPSVQNNILSRDFSQMFPSSECIIFRGARSGESVGVQTGDSLLYPKKSVRRNDSVTSASTGERESTAESSGKRVLRSGSGRVKQNNCINKRVDYSNIESSGRTSNEMKPVTKKHYVEKNHRSLKMSRDKDITKERRKNKTSESKVFKKRNSNNKEFSGRSQKADAIKDKAHHQKDPKVVSKSKKVESITKQEGRRAVLRSEKQSDFISQASSSRPGSESENKVVSSDSSLPQSVENNTLSSSEYGSASSSKNELIRKEGRHSQSSQRGSSHADSYRGSEQHLRHIHSSSTKENSCSSRDQQQKLLDTKESFSKDDQSSLDEPHQGLKGGAEESVVPKTSRQMISKPRQAGKTKHWRADTTKYSTNNYMIYKSTQSFTTVSKSDQNLMNKANSVPHNLQEEADLPTIVKAPDSIIPREHKQPGALSLAWTRQRVSENKKPVSFEVNLAIQENLCPSDSDPKVTTTKRTLTLQEALARARPDYLREAGDRHALIRLKREMRQTAQTHNHQVLAQIPPNLQTPSTLQRFLFKTDVAPLFSYKDIRQQNQRLYNLLPEARAPGARHHRAAAYHTNRLLAKLYSQRLRKKVMQGRVSHAHKEVVTPLANRHVQK